MKRTAFVIGCAFWVMAISIALMVGIGGLLVFCWTALGTVCFVEWASNE